MQTHLSPARPVVFGSQTPTPLQAAYTSLVEALQTEGLLLKRDVQVNQIRVLGPQGMIQVYALQPGGLAKVQAVFAKLGIVAAPDRGTTHYNDASSQVQYQLFEGNLQHSPFKA